MRFLFVSDFECDANSGAAGSLIAIADALRARGHTVELLWSEGSRVGGGLHRLVELPVRQLRQIERALASGPFDVVIVSQPYAFTVFERLPRLHPGTLFLNRTHGWEERFAAAGAALGFAPATASLAGLKRLVGRAWTRRNGLRTARAAHGIVCASSHCGRFIAETSRIPAKRVAVIPYGVTPAFLDPGPAPERGARRMLYVGNYLDLKGSKVLEAVLPAIGRRFPDARMTFVVDPGAVAGVRTRYAAAFGERLVVSPWMSRDELVRIYREHDVFLFPSLFEGFGKTFLEAMASGACVVGSDQGGLPDLATNGVHALYGPPGDAARMSDLLGSALADPERARAIGERARARAAEFTWSRNAAETERFCDELRGRLPRTGT